MPWQGPGCPESTAKLAQATAALGGAAPATSFPEKASSAGRKANFYPEAEGLPNLPDLPKRQILYSIPSPSTQGLKIREMQHAVTLLPNKTNPGVTSFPESQVKRAHR